MEASLPVFDVQQTWTGRVVVVSAHGDVDALTAPRLAEELDRALADLPTAVIVDLSDVDFLASTGMAVLLSVHERVADTAQLMVVADGPSTSRPLKLMAIDLIIPVHPTLDDAVDAVNTTVRSPE